MQPCMENVGFRLLLPSQPSPANGSPRLRPGHVYARLAGIRVKTSRLATRRKAHNRFSERPLSPNLSTPPSKYRGRNFSFINAVRLADLESQLVSNLRGAVD